MSIETYVNGVMPRVVNAVVEEHKALAWSRYPLLVMVAIASDLLTPILIWKRVIPGSVRWISDLAVALLLVWAVARMLGFNRIPGAALIVLAYTAIGTVVAHFSGQAGLVTAWGWWVMFRYPIVGLYTYLQPSWPTNFAGIFLRFCVWLAAFELVVQLGQFATGEVPGDDLAGTFGRHGVGPLTMTLLFVLCMVWGRWLVNRDWKPLALVMVMGVMSSSLGEIKFYPVALAIVSGLALFLYAIRGGRLQELFLYGLALAALLAVFGFLYNMLVSDVRGTRRIEEYFVWETTETYLNNIEFDESAGIYRFGRGFAVTYGLEVIQKDPVTLLFGLGIGARSESTHFGLVGVGMQQGEYGVTSSPSSLIFIEELGLAGIFAFGLFLLSIIVTLLRYASRQSPSELTMLSLGLVLYSTCLPLWIWYHDMWNFGVAMMLYWGALGYMLHEVHAQPDAPSANENVPVYSRS